MHLYQLLLVIHNTINCYRKDKLLELTRLQVANNSTTVMLFFAMFFVVIFSTAFFRKGEIQPEIMTPEEKEWFADLNWDDETHKIILCVSLVV